MPDALKHVRANLPFRPNARTWNDCIDAAVAVRKSQRTGVGVPVDLQRPWIVVRNASTHDLDRNDAIGLNGPLWSPSENLDEFRNHLAFEGEIPKSGHLGRFGVLLEDVPAGRFGRAIASGPVIAHVNFNSPDDVFADVVSGGVALESGPTGSARIVWAAGRSGVQRAVVNLSNNPDAALTSVFSSSSGLSSSGATSASSSSTRPLSSGDFGDCFTNCQDGTGSLSLCYELVMSGLTDATCSGADDFNGSFVIVNCDHPNAPGSCASPLAGDECVWSVDQPESHPCAGGPMRYYMYDDLLVGGLFRLVLANTDTSWLQDNDEIDCSGPLTMTLDNDGGQFGNLPNALTLEPVPCPE